MGADVTFCSDKPFKNLFLIALLRLKPKWVWFIANRIYVSWLEKNAPAECDIVFVIKGEGISPQILNILKGRYKNAFFVLYLWDSISNVRNVEEKFPYFNHIFSFDPEDCKQYGNLKYRPLFFLEKYYKKNTSIGNGIFFIGTLNGDRSKVISKLSKSLNNKQVLDFSLFVRSRVELFIRKLFDHSLNNNKSIKLLKEPMSIDEINQRIDNCTAVLDIEHAKQKGLTMRTFEVLASRKKLITTNKTIIDHDFYDSSNIFILDREKPVIPNHFFDLPNNELPHFFIDRYSIKGWISEILG